MKQKKQQIVACLQQQGLLPLYYHDEANVSINIMKVLYKAGVRVFEYTNRGSNAILNFSKMVEYRNVELPDLLLGIGTIKSLKDAQNFAHLKADFLVAPIVNVEVAKFANENYMLWIPGCMTPSEIYLAQQYKAEIIKIFPANIVGVDFLLSIKDLFPDQLFMPTGGVEIEIENLKKWFNAGVMAVGMGSKLINTKAIGNDIDDQLLANTKKVLELIASIKNKGE